jgi:hypothetical protein
MVGTLVLGTMFLVVFLQFRYVQQPLSTCRSEGTTN